MVLIAGGALSSNHLHGLYLPTGADHSVSGRVKCSIDIG